MNTDHPYELISAWADGELPQPEQARLEVHLRECDACRALLADFRTLAAAARHETIPPIPADLAARIGSRTATMPRPARVTRFPIFRMRLPLATAAAVLLLVSMWIVWEGRTPERLEPEQKVSSAPILTEPPVPPGAPTPPAPVAPPHRTAARADSAAAPPSPAPAPVTPTAGGARPQAAAPIATPPIIAAPQAAAPQAAAPPAANKSAAAAAAGTESAVAPLGVAGSAKAMSPSGHAEADMDRTGFLQRERQAPMPTLVFHLPEGQVTVTSEHVVTIVSGDYRCRLDAAGPEENKALDGLFDLARTAEPAPLRTGVAGASPDAARDEITIPAPGETGALSSEVTAEMQRRLRSLLAERYLPRAEAACGAPPAALRQLH
jgi:Putative zinc-finger